MSSWCCSTALRQPASEISSMSARAMASSFIAAGEHSLHLAPGGAFLVELDALQRQAAPQYPQAAVERLLGRHRQPLEGRAGFRDKGGGVNDNAGAAAAAFQSVFNRQRQFDDFLDVLIGLGGQADDEIELELGKALRGNHVHRSQNIVGGDAFINDVPQALRTGLGGDGDGLHLAFSQLAR